MTKKYLSLTLISILGVIMYANAQRSVTHQSLYWIRYYQQLQLSPRFTLHAEIEDRRFFKNNIQHHLINHYRIHYKNSPLLDVAGGITFSWQSPQIPDGIHNLIVPEIRGVQEVNLTQNINQKFILAHRFRIDERFIHKNNELALEDGYDFNFRFRYRFQLSYKLNKTFRFKAGDEIMINKGINTVKNTFDQNRIYFSLETEFSNSIALELTYIKWYQQRPSSEEYFSRDIIRLSFLHKIVLQGRSNKKGKN